MTTPQDATEALARALPCEDPEEPCDADGRDEHQWCDHCIARSVLLRRRPVIAAAIAADGWSVVRSEDVVAARRLLRAVDDAALEALADAEDGAEEPEWQTRLWYAADEARAVLGDPS